MSKIAIATLGCKVNQYDSQALAEAFKAEGFEVVPFSSKADVYIINTCAVTARSESKCRQLIRKTIRRSPGSIVAVTGCYSQVRQSEVATLPGVCLVSGTQDRLGLVKKVRRALAGEPLSMPVKGETWDWEEAPVRTHQGRHRAYVKVQDGCDQCCSYCIVPVARGPSRSRPVGRVLDEVTRLEEAGYREIVLSGIHLGHYSGGLTQLVRSVIAVTGSARIRLSSIEPEEVGDDLLDAMASNPRVCRHLHVPLQSGSDRVLGLMNRRYTSWEYLDTVKKARAAMPDLGLSTDVMVGFPGEDEADFQDTVSVVKAAGFSRLHVFRYSERPGTPAASMPAKVSPKVKEARSGMLQELGAELAMDFHRGLRGTRVEVLVEGVAGGLLKGHSSSYVEVRFPGPPGLAGSLVWVMVKEALPQYVVGRHDDAKERP
ncbi:MAG: tRNA (N(6)-L-threonylcarbamoyladenosine(37)-C(2))-methylthiotransferase MtaB [Bacillota bacterium]